MRASSLQRGALPLDPDETQAETAGALAIRMPAIFSRAVKERWMAAFPDTFFTDSVGASETGFQGTGLQDAESIKGEGARVSLGTGSVVLDGDETTPIAEYACDFHD